MGVPVAAQNVLVVMIVFGSITAIVGLGLFIPLYFRAQKRRTIYKTIELFSARGQAVPPEVLESLTREPGINFSGSKDADLRRGVILLSVALALAIFGYMVDDPRSPLIGIAALPGLIGLAYIGFHFYAAKKPA